MSSTPIGDPRKSGEEGPAGDQRAAGEEGVAGDPRPGGQATITKAVEDKATSSEAKPTKKSSSKKS